VGEMRVSRVLLFLTLEGAKLTYPANGYTTGSHVISFSIRDLLLES
jgi:hypothetical protein